MVLDRKHFDDMDDFCDFDEKIDASCEGDISESGPAHPLSWRRVIIEKAVNNVKRAAECKTDLQLSYKKGDLVFDEEANKFGRVVESRPGFLNLSLVGGGKVIRKNVNELDFVRENRHKLTLREMADKIFLSEIEIIALLNQLELETEKIQETTKKSKPSSLPKKNIKLQRKALDKKKSVKASPIPKEIKLPIKTNVKIAAKNAGHAAKGKDIIIGFTKLLPKGATTDPVRDPNGYIQQNFLLMTNRELAFATGLSEHTIRRKLGEWNLKRKDFVNKA